MKCFTSTALMFGFFISLLGCGADSHSGCQGMPGAYQKNIGQTAPDFSLPLLENENQKAALSEVVKDHSVLLAFWATWCPSCVEEIPRLNEWNQKYAAQGLKILAVNVEEPRDRILAFKQENPIDYQVLLDLEGDVTNQFGVVGLPSAVVLAKGGEIIYYGFGLPTNIEELLQGGK